ncbi:MAG: DNA topoisomerase III [Eubacteriales bacterium]|nr:DNA topoisomerase III [Eubacteriales bacterium]
MKTLVLAEKPSVGRELARVLNCKRSGNGCLEGDRYIVTWALGHLVTLADPEKYGEQYKKWSLETLPMLPEKMELVVIPQTSRQYSAVRDCLKREDVSDLVIATDAGREGELVARWIIEKAGFRKPVKRLWISSQTDKAIKQGFASLKDGREYLKLYKSAVCRAEADWYVGLNVTRALTCRHNAQLSAGRVQTPTLALIVARENEIRSFRPVDYRVISADLGRFFVTYRDAQGHSSVFDLAEAERIAGLIKNKDFTVTDVTSSPKRTPPPALYDLTELQRDANKMYSFSAKHTLDVMQKLYEYHKALTYPRTDSRYITDDIVPTLKERLSAVAFGDFTQAVRTCVNINKSCVNNAKVSDHHAIIPTEERADLTDMTADEKKIYFLVIRRFLCNFQGDHCYNQTKITAKCEGLTFTASGKAVTDEGWRKLYSSNTSDDEEEQEEADQTLPTVKKGEIYKCKNVQLKALKTTPPPRYNEASLLGAMENPSKYIKDAKMKAFISGGLGTPATRADIIEKLFNVFYLEKKGNTIYPTGKAEQLINIVPADLKEPLMTAKWEQRLDGIAKGQESGDVFIKEIRAYSAALVNEVKNGRETYVHDNLTKEKCPDCGKFLLKVEGKKGTMLVCSDRECGFRKSLTFKSNVRCPQCHKPMEVFGESEKRTYVCVCGFRQNVDKFHAEKGSGGASKRDVQSYLTNQNKSKPKEESPLAAAMRKAMEEKSGK